MADGNIVLREREDVGRNSSLVGFIAEEWVTVELGCVWCVWLVV